MEFRPALEEIDYHHLKKQITRSELNSHLRAKPFTGGTSSSAEHSLDRLALGFKSFSERHGGTIIQGLLEERLTKVEEK